MTDQTPTPEENQDAQELHEELQQVDTSVGDTKLTTEEVEDRENFIRAHTGGEPPEITPASEEEAAIEEAQQRAQEITNQVLETMLPPGIRLPRQNP